jgi:hypothetical protein
MIIAAALCPSPPLLLPPLTGAAVVLPELRHATRDLVAELLAAGPEVVAVVGAGEVTTRWADGSPSGPASFAPGTGLPPGELPSAVTVGRWLVEKAEFAGELAVMSVAGEEPAAECARIGAGLAEGTRRVALLAMGDGSACRGPKAPGYLDPRAHGFDAEVERAVRAGELDALLRLDPELAGELMVTGRVAWQVLAGALAGVPVETRVRYCDDPFGVAYLAASVTVASVTVAPVTVGSARVREA